MIYYIIWIHKHIQMRYIDIVIVTVSENVELLEIEEVAIGNRLI